MGGKTWFFKKVTNFFPNNILIHKTIQTKITNPTL